MLSPLIRVEFNRFWDKCKTALHSENFALFFNLKLVKHNFKMKLIIDFKCSERTNNGNNHT